MSTQPSTTITWTMQLRDAALISDTLNAAAEQHERQADYLESERYADAERERYMASEPAEGEPQRRRSQWSLSKADQDRIVEHRALAFRLRKLVMT